MEYLVRYEILIEARTDSFLGSSRSDLQSLSTVVNAANPGQAQAMVENQFGGHSRCRVYSAVPVL
jgi:hypothetical protein